MLENENLLILSKLKQSDMLSVKTIIFIEAVMSASQHGIIWRK